ncbi:MAG: thioesterase [Mesorhizobium sp.]|uniref:thioesterase family protein n=1 Tax=Mesorhizobium sp. TaxID=1871066 RepID=UPI001227BDBD|nr:thioesterase family protein [Mesorhizobium sp.]TIU72048.1 MAG: thioesterase [Mesorhizobium sp.]TIW10439.1 MAG: thioesterase [Mesorhizobium sp.]TIW71516.1 MAG: thioesterase [Mesorhizobium sp.]TIX73531.1 MAG: thioesterase [Mesorhizobium sp.]
MAIEPAWIDYNGHLNMAYYNVLFDRNSDAAFAALGLGPAYAERRRLTTFVAETHVCYVRELRYGDEVVGSFRLLDRDGKRLHFFQELHHADEGWLAATSESLALHVDMSGPKVCPFPPDIKQNIDRMFCDHSTLPRPARAGKAVGLGKG